MAVDLEVGTAEVQEFKCPHCGDTRPPDPDGNCLQCGRSRYRGTDVEGSES